MIKIANTYALNQHVILHLTDSLLQWRGPALTLHYERKQVCSSPYMLWNSSETSFQKHSSQPFKKSSLFGGQCLQFPDGFRV